MTVGDEFAELSLAAPQWFFRAGWDWRWLSHGDLRDLSSVVEQQIERLTEPGDVIVLPRLCEPAVAMVDWVARACDRRPVVADPGTFGAEPPDGECNEGEEVGETSETSETSEMDEIGEIGEIVVLEQIDPEVRLVRQSPGALGSDVRRCWLAASSDSGERAQSGSADLPEEVGEACAALERLSGTRARSARDVLVTVGRPGTRAERLAIALSLRSGAALQMASGAADWVPAWRWGRPTVLVAETEQIAVLIAQLEGSDGASIKRRSLDRLRAVISCDSDSGDRLERLEGALKPVEVAIVDLGA